MAKTAKKKADATVNPRSRAAKRATSPSIDVDKSIKDAPRALGTSPTLGVSRGSGISKKKKTKPLTKGQRVRQEKGLARAEAVMDQMEKKVDSAKAKLKARHLRKALWDDINDTAADEQRKAIKGPGSGATNDQTQDQEKESNQEAGEIEMGNTHSSVPDSSTSTPAQQDINNAAVQQTPAQALPNDDADLIT